MYLSLYRKWRPRVFDEISGQEHITSILKKQCESNRVSHAYLFCGTRGTGKTSSAKILAKAVNCENPQNGNPCNECSSCKAIDSGSATDVLEIDAASNNRVDNVRDLRDEVVYPPSVLKKRVYIIDEVHMLTDSAFNALLKTLEEPPEYVVFILATTEINELPPTIISRCIRFDFSRIHLDAVKKRLEYVAQQENIELGEGASDLLAQLADGSMRDALSLLEACSNGHSSRLERDNIREVLGLAGEEIISKFLHTVAVKDIPSAMEIIAEVHRSSKDIAVFIDDVSLVVRDIVVDKQLVKSGKTSALNPIYSGVADELTIEVLFYISSVLEETQGRISKYATNKRIVLEMAVIRMCDRSLSDAPKALAARISELEKRISVLSAVGATVQTKVENAVTNINTPEEKSVTLPPAPISQRILFPDVADVYDFLSNNSSLCAFLKKAAVFKDEDTIIVSGDKITISLLQKPESAKEITDAFISVVGKLVKVVFEISNENKKDEAQISLIDELN